MVTGGRVSRSKLHPSLTCVFGKMSIDWRFLEYSLAGVEVGNLVEEFSKYHVIDEGFKERICKLDLKTLESGTALRYFLAHLVKINDSGKTEKLKKCLKEKFHFSFDLCTLTADQITSNIGDYIVSFRDENFLVKILHEVAPKSEVLGVALNLPGHIRFDCMKVDSCVISLTNILHAWIKHSKMPKLQVLIDALNSPLINFANVAEKIKEEFIDQLLSHEQKVSSQNNTVDNVCANIKVNEGKSTLLEAWANVNERIKHCQWLKDDKIIKDGRDYYNTDSSILFVHEADLFQQGRYECRILDSDGKAMIESQHIDLTVELSPERLKLISRYSFKPEVSGNHWPPARNTKYINLAIVSNWGEISPNYRYTIRGDMDDINRDKEKVTYESAFEHFGSKNLVLIEGRPGSGKTTLVHKICIDWAEVGNVLKHTQLLFLISLRMLSAKEKSLFDVLSKLFYADPAEKHELNSLITKLMKTNGSKVCFILDGLDEYDLDNMQDSVIYRLIYKEFLSDSMVIVTSRPVATSNLKESIHRIQCIEVLGFPQSEIFTYVHSYPFVNSEEAKGLTLYLIAHRNVFQMCYLPVHVAMVCFLYSKLGNDIPHTESAIYEKFTVYTILRHFYRDSNHSGITSLYNLNGSVKESFHVICKHAFELTASVNQIMHSSDLPRGLESHMLGIVTVDKIAELYGMEYIYSYHHLTFQEYLAAWYVHLVEDVLGIEEQFKLIKLNLNKLHMNAAWKFYCGITNFESKISQFESIISSCNSDCLYAVQCAFETQQEKACNNVIQSKGGVMSFQNQFLLEQDVMALNFTINKASILLTQLEFDKCSFQATPHIDSHKLAEVSRIAFRRHNPNQSHIIEYFLKKVPQLSTLDLTDSSLHIPKLTKEVRLVDLKSIKFSLFQFACFSFDGYLMKNETLQLLKFGSHCIRNVSINLVRDYEMIPDSMQPEYYYYMRRCDTAINSKSCEVFGFVPFFHGALPNVYLVNARVTLSNIKLILPESYSKCVDLSLINCNIDDETAEELARGLKYSLNLKHLNLGFNCITDIGARALASALRTHRFLCSLRVIHNRIGDEGALSLLESTQKCKNLSKFDFQCNNITKLGVQTINNFTKQFKSNLKLRLWNKHLNFQNQSNNILELQSCNLSLTSQYLPEMLSHNLLVLDLSFNWLTILEFEKMVPYLSTCTNLEELIMSYNLMGSSYFAFEDSYNFNENFKTLLSHCSRINLIDVSINYFNSEEFNFKSVQLSHLTDLQYLDFSDNFLLFSYEQAMEIGKCKHLSTLLVNGCHLELPVLIQIITNCKKLTRIGLNWNYCVSDAFELVVDYLKLLPELRILELGVCNIGHKVCKIKPINGESSLLLQQSVII